MQKKTKANQLMAAQQLMADLYLERDNKRGIDRTMLWFVSEVGELIDCILKSSIDYSLTEHSEIGQELADCLAWLCSVANILKIDLQKALLSKYPNSCSKCHLKPCKCVFK